MIVTDILYISDPTLYQPQSLCIIPDQLLYEMDSDLVIDDLKDGLPLTDRQLGKLEEEPGRQKTKLLIKMLKEHHDTEQAYTVLLETLQDKDSNLYQKIRSHKLITAGMCSVFS